MSNVKITWQKGMDILMVLMLGFGRAALKRFVEKANFKADRRSEKGSFEGPYKKNWPLQKDLDYFLRARKEADGDYLIEFGNAEGRKHTRPTAKYIADLFEISDRSVRRFLLKVSEVIPIEYHKPMKGGPPDEWFQTVDKVDYPKFHALYNLLLGNIPEVTIACWPFFLDYKAFPKTKREKVVARNMYKLYLMQKVLEKINPM
jgi:hypothetical protein